MVRRNRLATASASIVMAAALVLSGATSASAAPTKYKGQAPTFAECNTLRSHKTGLGYTTTECTLDFTKRNYAFLYWKY